MSAEKLFDKIRTTECINCTFSKEYERLIDRISIPEGTVHAIRIMSKDEILSLMDRLHTLESSVKALEHNTGQEIQTLQKTMVKRFEKTEEIINSDEQEQKVERQNLTPSVSKTFGFRRILAAYPVITSEKITGSKNPKVIKKTYMGAYTYELSERI